MFLAVASDCGDPTNKTEFSNYTISSGNTSRFSWRRLDCRRGFASAAGGAALQPIQCADGTWNSTASWWNASFGCTGATLICCIYMEPNVLPWKGARSDVVLVGLFRLCVSDACCTFADWVCVCVDFAADECIDSGVCGAFTCVNTFQSFLCGVSQAVQPLLLACESYSAHPYAVLNAGKVEL